MIPSIIIYYKNEYKNIIQKKSNIQRKILYKEGLEFVFKFSSFHCSLNRYNERIFEMHRLGYRIMSNCHTRDLGL